MKAESQDDLALGLLVAAVAVGLLLLGALFVGLIIWAGRRNRRRTASAEETRGVWREGALAVEERRGAWREGVLLVMDRESELPPRCIFCNGDESVRIRRRFSWHSPWLYFLILAGFLIYAIVATIQSQRVRLAIPLCHTHQRRRSAAISTAWALTVAGLGGCVAGMRDEGPGFLFALGSAAILAALIVGFRSRLRPARIDDRRIGLRGAGKAFLDSLPTATDDLRRAA